MELKEFRRQRLRALVKELGGAQAFVREASKRDADKPIDVTHVRQMMGGHRKIGEEAARNLERRAGLPCFYLDGDDGQLLDLFRRLPQRFRQALLTDARKYLELAGPEVPPASAPFPAGARPAPLLTAEDEEVEALASP